MQLSRRERQIAAGALMLPLAALKAPAQDHAGKFRGTVFDPRNAAIPNATVDSD